MGNLCDGRRKPEDGPKEPSLEKRKEKIKINIDLKKLEDSPLSPHKQKFSFNPEDSSPRNRQKNHLDVQKFLVPQNAEPIGKWECKVIDGKIYDIPNNIISECNSFVSLSVLFGTEEKVTKVYNQSKSPVWDELFYVNFYENQLPCLLFRLSLKIGDEILTVGNLLCNAKSLIDNNYEFEGKLFLLYRSFRSAVIKISIRYIPNQKMKPLDGGEHTNYWTFGSVDRKQIIYMPPDEYPLKDKCYRSSKTPKFIAEKTYSLSLSSNDAPSSLELLVAKHDRQSLLQVISDPKITLADLYELLQLEDQQYTYNIVSRIKFLLIDSHKQDEVFKLGLERFDQILRNYKSNFLIIYQTVTLLAKFDPQRIDIYSDEMLFLLVELLDETALELNLEIILDLLRNKSLQFDLEKRYLVRLCGKTSFIDALIKLIDSCFNNTIIVSGAIKLIFDICTLSEDHGFRAKIGQVDSFMLFKKAVEKYHFNYDLVKTTIKVVQYILASTSKKIKLLEAFDVNTFNLVYSKYKNDPVILKFVIAVLKDSCSDLKFLTKYSETVFAIISKVVNENLNEKDINVQASSALFRISEKVQLLNLFEDQGLIEAMIEQLSVFDIGDSETIIYFLIKTFTNLEKSSKVIEIIKKSKEEYRSHLEKISKDINNLEKLSEKLSEIKSNVESLLTKYGSA